MTVTTPTISTSTSSTSAAGSAGNGGASGINGKSSSSAAGSSTGTSVMNHLEERLVEKNPMVPSGHDAPSSPSETLIEKTKRLLLSDDEDKEDELIFVKKRKGPDLITVHVESLMGTVHVLPSLSLEQDTMASLKLLVYEVTGILPEQQILVVDSSGETRPLTSEGSTLKEEGFYDGIRVRLLVPMSGGPGSFLTTMTTTAASAALLENINIIDKASIEFFFDDDDDDEEGGNYEENESFLSDENCSPEDPEGDCQPGEEKKRSEKDHFRVDSVIFVKFVRGDTDVEKESVDNNGGARREHQQSPQYLPQHGDNRSSGPVLAGGTAPKEVSQAPGSSSGTVLTLEEPRNGALSPLPSPQPSCCSLCDKRLRLTNSFSCRCSQVFCPQHRHPHIHNCSYDYVSAGRLALARENPLVTKDKLNRLS